MAYFKIGDRDYSPYVKGLKINKSANYSAQTNANGDMVVDFINHKRVITAEFIYINDEVMSQLQADIDEFAVSLSFRNPRTNALESGVVCIIPQAEIDYYTIQAGKTLYKEFELEFTEM